MYYCKTILIDNKTMWIWNKFFSMNFSSSLKNTENKNRSRGVLWKEVFLEISQNSLENNHARASFLIKFRPQACSFIKKGHWHRCFPVNFVKFLRTPFLLTTFGSLLLVKSLNKTVNVKVKKKISLKIN